MNYVYKTLFGCILILSGCSSMKPSDFEETSPKLLIEDYFAGETSASGIFEDRFGNIKRQFVVDMAGEWDGKTLTLDEHFVYNDGERERRVWYIKKTGENTYEGRAGDVVGLARGKAAGNSLNWQYKMSLDTSFGKINVDFNDWMFLQSSGLIINRAAVTKFGLVIGTVTLVFQKKESRSQVPQPSNVTGLNNSEVMQLAAQR